MVLNDLFETAPYEYESAIWKLMEENSGKQIHIVGCDGIVNNTTTTRGALESEEENDGGDSCYQETFFNKVFPQVVVVSQNSNLTQKDGKEDNFFDINTLAG